MIVVLIITCLALLLSAASVAPHRSTLSEYELRRRLDSRQKGALLQWRRGELYAELMAVRRVIIAFLLVLTSALMIHEFGWLIGLTLSFTLTVLYNRLASLPPMRGLVQKYYDQREARILKWLDDNRRIIRPLRGKAERNMEQRLGSRKELEHIVDQSATYFDEVERAMLKAAMSFRGRKVGDHMTPRSRMEAIGANELLGPLVLDDLYKTGHSHFPVFEADLDNIIGMLHIHSLFSVLHKESKMVRDVMLPQVFYVRDDELLQVALSVCIKHRRHLLVVVSEYDETVGVITIEDILNQLLGGPVEPISDNHDDRSAVAGGKRLDA